MCERCDEPVTLGDQLPIVLTLMIDQRTPLTPNLIGAGSVIVPCPHGDVNLRAPGRGVIAAEWARELTSNHSKAAREITSPSIPTANRRCTEATPWVMVW